MSTIRTNDTSKLLTSKENELVHSLIGVNCVTVATGVAQLYFSKEPDHGAWNLFRTGVVCLVRDASRRSYFIKMIDILKEKCLWEQELYSKMVPKMTTKVFISFEADKCMAGMNYSSPEEASRMFSMLTEKLNVKTEKREVSMAVESQVSSKTQVPAEIEKQKKKKIREKKKKSESKPKLVISAPQEFRHVNHVGFDPGSGFNLANCDPQWKKLFNSIGLTQKNLSDADTSKFIYDFITTHGGIEKAVNEIESLEKARKPVPAVGSRSSRPPPPPPQGPPGEPVCAPPKFSPRPDPHSSKVPGGVPPPPPPPPPLPSPSSAPPAPVPPPLSNNVASKPATRAPPTLLEQINQGYNLKKTEATSQEKIEAPADDGGILGILAARLNEMRVKTADDESDEEGSSEEEWDE